MALPTLVLPKLGNSMSTLQKYQNAAGSIGQSLTDAQGQTLSLPPVSPVSNISMPVLPSLKNKPAEVGVVYPVAPPSPPPGVPDTRGPDNSTTNEREAQRNALQSMPEFDRFDDWSSAIGLGMKNAAALGMFGLDPVAMASVAKDITRGHGFSSNYDQAMSMLGLDFDTVQRGLSFSKGVDLDTSVSSSDYGYSGPSSMPNSINDPGAMTSQELSDFARTMTAARAPASTNRNNDGGMGSASYGGPSGMANSINDPGAMSVDGLRDSYANYSASLGGYNGSSHQAAGGGGGADGNNGAGGSSDNRVICTHFYKKGELDRALWAADTRWTIEHISPHIQRGYQIWGVPYVKLMRKYKFFETIVRPLALHRANEIGYQLGMRDKPDYIGKLGRIVLEGISWFAGWLPIEPISYKTLYTNSDTK